MISSNWPRLSRILLASTCRCLSCTILTLARVRLSCLKTIKPESPKKISKHQKLIFRTNQRPRLNSGEGDQASKTEGLVASRTLLTTKTTKAPSSTASLRFSQIGLSTATILTSENSSRMGTLNLSRTSTTLMKLAQTTRKILMTLTTSIRTDPSTFWGRVLTQTGFPII